MSSWQVEVSRSMADWASSGLVMSRNQCSSAIDCSTTQRCTLVPEPCSLPRQAIAGVIPFSRTCRRYLSWS